MPGVKDHIFNVFTHAARYCRLRHFRGHGVHSPFAYGLVRNIYMKRRHLPAEGTVYSALREHGGTARQASLIQALYDYLACRQCCIDAEPVAENPAREGGASMEVFTTAAAVSNETLPAPGHIVCLLSPAKGKARYRGCMEAVSSHRGMSIDCRTVILLFGSDALNNEHIKL